MRSCLNDAVINYSPRIGGGGGMKNEEPYRECTPRRLKETKIEELEKIRFHHRSYENNTNYGNIQKNRGALGIIKFLMMVFICSHVIPDNQI